MPLREADIRTLAHWIGPDYVIPAAEDHGHGDAVMGAKRAYEEVRGLVRSYSRYVAHREGEPVAGLGLAKSLRAMGYVGNYQAVAPVETEWRETACALWELAGTGFIRGYTEVEVGDAKDSLVHRAVLRALARILIEHPETNRAVLRRRVWRRFTAEIMLHIEPAPDDVRTVIVNPLGLSDETLRRKLFRAFRGTQRAEKHPLRPVAGQVLRAWAAAGFIASPAAAMVSPVGAVGVPRGTACLVPANGIPLSITIGQVREGRCMLGLEADHRAFDATACGRIYQGMEALVPELLHG